MKTKYVTLYKTDIVSESKKYLRIYKESIKKNEKIVHD